MVVGHRGIVAHVSFEAGVGPIEPGLFAVAYVAGVDTDRKALESR